MFNHKQLEFLFPTRGEASLLFSSLLFYSILFYHNTLLDVSYLLKLTAIILLQKKALCRFFLIKNFLTKRLRRLS